MTPSTLVPIRWFSWEFRLDDPGGMTWGHLSLSSWRERGSLTVGGQQYPVRRQGLRGPFILQGPDGEMATAIKHGAFRQEFSVTADHREYRLKRLSWWRREFAVFSGETRIGSIAPLSWFTRRAEVDLPAELPEWTRAFVVWLTLLMWKRDSDAAT